VFVRSKRTDVIDRAQRDAQRDGRVGRPAFIKMITISGKPRGGILGWPFSSTTPPPPRNFEPGPPLANAHLPDTK
jgi:hypothetical protein